MTTNGALTNYGEQIVLNNFYRGTAYTPRDPTYFALFTSDPTDAAVGNEVSTVGTGYARQPITWGPPSIETVDPNFIDSYTIKNTNEIVFPRALINWGTVTHWGVSDQSTAGNLLAHGRLEVPATVTTGNEYIFPIAGTALFLSGETYSDIYARAMLNLLFRNTVQMPTPLFLALYATNPTAFNTGIEVNVGNYVRQPITFGEITADPSGRSLIRNIYDILFPPATVQYPMVTHMGIVTAQTGGQLLLYTPVNIPVSIQQSEQYKISVNDLVVGLD